MEPSIPSFGVDRRALLSTLAVLPVLSAPLFSVSASAQTVLGIPQDWVVPFELKRIPIILKHSLHA